MNKALKKLLALLLGFITILIIIEVVLRVVGFTYRSQTSADTIADIDTTSDYRILSIGDSFTRGMGAPIGKDFSSRLGEMLNSNSDKSFSVVNAGLSGANSSQILKKLQGNIDAVKPDLIVLMFGGANTWNHWGLREAGRGSSFLRDIIYDIRLYKLAVLFINNIRNKPGDEDNTGSFLEKGEYERARREFESAVSLNPNNGRAYYNYGKYYLREREIKQAEGMFLEGIEKDPSLDLNYMGLGATYQMIGEIDKGLVWLEKGLNINPMNLDIYNQLCMLNNWKGNYTDQVRWAKEAVRTNPRVKNFFMFFRIVSDEFAQMNKADIDSFLVDYPEQNATEFLEFDDPCFYDTPMDILDKKFLENQESIMNWIKSDIEKVITICKEQNIKLIIQNYPLRPHGNFWVKSVTPVNEILKQSSLDHNVPFVDNDMIFKMLGPKLDDYLEPMGGSEHCNEKGYELMASNLYKKISEEGFLKK